jgi:hypothetical protein
VLILNYCFLRNLKQKTPKTNKKPLILVRVLDILQVASKNVSTETSAISNKGFIIN